MDVSAWALKACDVSLQTLGRGHCGEGQFEKAIVNFALIDLEVAVRASTIVQHKVPKGQVYHLYGRVSLLRHT